MDGIVVLDKPAGWTSHDVVAKARGLLGTRKVGHSGTLDPDATGVLVLGVGRATRLLRFLTESTKAYVGEMVLGTSTSTLDASGTVTATYDMGEVTLEQVRAVALRFVGEIDQIPPMVSAVKVDGRRLHVGQLAPRDRLAGPRDRPAGFSVGDLLDEPEVRGRALLAAFGRAGPLAEAGVLAASAASTWSESPPASPAEDPESSRCTTFSRTTSIPSSSWTAETW